MRMRGLYFAAALIALASAVPACTSESSDMQDGYYTAEEADFDEYGWKEYITVYINDGNMTTVEYDAFNASGFVKSWDIDYMRTMNTECGTYPNEFTRAYAVALINWQNPEGVDAISGATHSHVKFLRLAKAAMAKARTGDKQVALVDPPDFD